MIKIGEKLNSSIPNTLEAMRADNTEYLVSLIKAQSFAGVDYLDINTALVGDGIEDEKGRMLALIKLIKENSPCGIMLDSPDPDVLRECLPFAADRKVIINSVTDSDKYDALLSDAVKYRAGVVVMPISDGDLYAEDKAVLRIDTAKRIIGKARSAGICNADIYVDAVIEAAALNPGAPLDAVRVIGEIKKEFPKVKTLIGLSNVSFGIPGRASVNAAFLAFAAGAGLDCAILDPTSKAVMKMLLSLDLLSGKDEYGEEYIAVYKAEKELAK